MSRFATWREGAIVMTLDLWLAAIVAFGLLAYLAAVLARPERF
jgi:K+-transporting ATPase KdpF subunit